MIKKLVTISLIITITAGSIIVIAGTLRRLYGL